MKPPRATLLFPILALLIAAPARAEAPADAPELKALVEKTIEAAGGRERIAAVKTMTVAGTVEMPAMRINGTFSLQKKPDRALMQVSLGQMGGMRIGWKDGIVWEQSDFTGTRIVAGSERDQLLRDLDFKHQFSRLEQLHDLHIDGSEPVNGAPAWRLVGKSDSGNEETHWIDKKTHHLLRLAMTVDTQMGKIKANMTFKDYQAIEGLSLPMTTEQSAAGAEMVMKITEVKLNPDLPDAPFELPEDVRKLAARQPASKPATQPAQP